MTQSCYECPVRNNCDDLAIALRKIGLSIPKMMRLVDDTYIRCAKKYLQEENHDNKSGHVGIVSNKNYTG